MSIAEGNPLYEGVPHFAGGTSAWKGVMFTTSTAGSDKGGKSVFEQIREATEKKQDVRGVPRASGPGMCPLRRGNLVAVPFPSVFAPSRGRTPNAPPGTRDWLWRKTTKNAIPCFDDIPCHRGRA